MAISESAGLLLKIKADSSQASAEIEKFKTDLKGIEAAAKGSLTTLQSLAANAGLTAEEFTALGTPIAAVGIELAVVTAAATLAIAATVALTEELYSLAKSAAEYGSKIHDAAQQGGVTAETMSALKFAAEQSGSSLEKIAGSVAKFDTLLGQAEAGNKKAEATLKQYGITAKTTDEALAQAVQTIGSMESASNQAAAAAALFKDRTGQILPVIESFKGNLPGLIQHLRDLGLIMSQEDADAADKFGDTIDTLNSQLDAIARTVGNAVIPAFSALFSSLSSWIAQNKGEISSWADFIGGTLSRIVTEVRSAANGFQHLARMSQQLGSGDLIGLAGEIGESQRDTDFYNNLRNNHIGSVSGGGKLPSGGGGGGGGGGRSRGGGGRGGGGDAGRAEKERLAQLEADAQSEIQIEQAKDKVIAQTYKTELAERVISEREAMEKRFFIEDEFLQFKLKTLKTELDAVEKSSLKKVDKDKETAKLRKEIQLTELDQEDTELKHSADYQAFLDKKRKAFAAYIKFLEEQQDKYDKEEQRRFDERQKAWHDFLQKKMDDQEKYDAEADRAAEARRQDRLNRTVGSGQEISSIGQLTDHFANSRNTAAIAGIQTLTDAFSGLGQAIGQVVQAWVLYGSAGQSVRQVTAQILAGIAQQAAVKAVFELAEGFAALAMAFFGIPNAGPSASAHFAAAAIYGGIAGIAAVAGRGVAGNSFKQGAAGAGGGNFKGQAGRQDLSDPNSPGNNFRNPLSGTNAVNGELTAVIRRLDAKITSMPADHVVAIGADGAADSIHAAVNKVNVNDTRAGNALTRTLGGRA